MSNPTFLQRVRRSRGAAAVEFAIWMPILAMLVSAVVDWGWYMTRRVSVARATMDGARIAAALYEPTTVVPGSVLKPAAEQRAKDVLNGMGMSCTASVCTTKATYCAVGAGGVCNNPPFNALVLEVTYQYTPFFGFVSIPTNMYDKFMMATENQ